MQLEGTDIADVLYSDQTLVTLDQRNEIIVHVKIGDPLKKENAERT